MRNTLAALLTTASLLACSPRYDLDSPIALDIDPALLSAIADCGGDPGELSADLEDAARQVETRIAQPGETTPNATIRVEALTDCDTAVTGGGSPAYVTVCAWPFCVSVGGFSSKTIVLHEFGHALGAHHLPCNDVNVMCATATDQTVYSVDDLADICEESSGGVCRRNQ